MKVIGFYIDLLNKKQFLRIAELFREFFSCYSYTPFLYWNDVGTIVGVPVDHLQIHEFLNKLRSYERTYHIEFPWLYTYGVYNAVEPFEFQ